MDCLAGSVLLLDVFVRVRCLGLEGAEAHIADGQTCVGRSSASP